MQNVQRFYCSSLPLVPVLNPDGYEYSRTKDRYWRKNRRKNSGSKCDEGIQHHGFEDAANGVMVDSYGVDLNRNFGKGFGEGGASTDPCSIFYTGPEAFSEPESAALRDYVQGLTAAVAVHSKAQVGER